MVTQSERLAIIETDIGYIKKGVGNIEDNLKEIIQKHLAHLDSEVLQQKNFCQKIQLEKKYGMTGKQKGLLYAAVIGAVTSIVVEVIRGLI